MKVGGKARLVCPRQGRLRRQRTATRGHPRWLGARLPTSSSWTPSRRRPRPFRPRAPRPASPRPPRASDKGRPPATSRPGRARPPHRPRRGPAGRSPPARWAPRRLGPACSAPPLDPGVHPPAAPPVPASLARPHAAPSAAAPAPRRQCQSAGQRAAASGDGFSSGDYSLGLFHHDASEASIALLADPEFRDAAAGSLLCLLDCADPDGRVHRAELPHKAREAEPSKPVIAQYALRCTRALGPEWAERHRVYPRVAAFQRWQERHLAGLHGLFLTWNSLQSGFDTDVLSAGFPDRSIEGPDTNAFMVLEYEALAELARLVGREDESEPWLQSAALLRRRMEDLSVDDALGHYVALRWEHGVGAPDAEIVGTRDVDGRRAPLRQLDRAPPLYAGIPSGRAGPEDGGGAPPSRGLLGPGGRPHLPRGRPVLPAVTPGAALRLEEGRRGPVSNWSGPVWVLSSSTWPKGSPGTASTARQASWPSRPRRSWPDDLAPHRRAARVLERRRGRPLAPERDLRQLERPGAVAADRHG